MESNRNALVIGATGLLGYGITLELHNRGWNVRATSNETLSDSRMFPEGVEYLCGDFYNEEFLSNTLKGVDKVFFFLSSTFPSTSTDSLELEISRTLWGLDYLLRKMRDNNVNQIVFPSSGGTVYGNVKNGFAREDSLLEPTTPYGIGKKMCEEVLKFYSGFGIASTVLRVGNVYGTPMIRKAAQGVIDIFIQKALNGDTATVWGDALYNERDYIFADDFSEAVAMITEENPDGMEVYNLGSGIGTSLETIIACINAHLDTPLNLKHIDNDSSANIKRIVLDMTKFKNKTGWIPKYSIEEGIVKTIERKVRAQSL